MSSRSTDAPHARKSGIQMTSGGDSFIPASKRADGSTRKEIKVRPGYRPPEDVETYKNRSAESWKTRGSGGVPGADPVAASKEDNPTKSKNAKRREAARKKTVAEGSTEDPEDALTSAMQATGLSEPDTRTKAWHDPSRLATNDNPGVSVEDGEQQKKIRNQLKKLRAIRELREKRAAGEKMAPDQIMKIGKEGELLRDLRKLGYNGPELQDGSMPAGDPS